MAVLPFDPSRLKRSAVHVATASSSRASHGGPEGGHRGLGLAASSIGGGHFVTHSSSPSYTTLYSQPPGVPGRSGDTGTHHRARPLRASRQRRRRSSCRLSDVNQWSGSSLGRERVSRLAAQSRSRRSPRRESRRLSSFRTSTTSRHSRDSSTPLSNQSRASRRAQVSLVTARPRAAALRSAAPPRHRRRRCWSTSTPAQRPQRPNQVQGISNLVASSVPGLDASSVTVVDNDGDVLSAPGIDASNTADSDSSTDRRL